MRHPSVLGAVVMLTIAAGLLTIDLDGPRYRWPDVLMPLSGFLLLFAIIVSSYRRDFFGSEDQGLSLSLTLGRRAHRTLLLLRLLANQPGPRWFPPGRRSRTVDGTHPDPDRAGNSFLRRGHRLEPGVSRHRQRSRKALTELVLIVSGLVTVVTISSRRLQAFYDDWRVANAALVEQSGVVRDMAEGVALDQGERRRLRAHQSPVRAHAWL